MPVLLMFCDIYHYPREWASLSTKPARESTCNHHQSTQFVYFEPLGCAKATHWEREKGHRACSTYDNEWPNLDIPRRERKSYMSNTSMKTVPALWWSSDLMRTTWELVELPKGSKIAFIRQLLYSCSDISPKQDRQKYLDNIPSPSGVPPEAEIRRRQLSGRRSWPRRATTGRLLAILSVGLHCTIPF